LPQLPKNISFASELIKARSDLGLTQSQLSSQSGLSLSAIKAYESGRNMPGARELRELSQALQVSPNKLLFGKELPFEPRTVMDQLTYGEPENEAVARMRAVTMFFLLASDEREAIFTLARSLAVARHGVDEVKNALLGADLMAGMTREMMQAGSDALRTGTPMDMDSFGPNLEAFMDRQGHNPDLKKLPKK
jgi:transcriptional regulator with XRE-family HTH domain